MKMGMLSMLVVLTLGLLVGANDGHAHLDGPRLAARQTTTTTAPPFSVLPLQTITLTTTTTLPQTSSSSSSRSSSTQDDVSVHPLTTIHISPAVTFTLTLNPPPYFTSGPTSSSSTGVNKGAIAGGVVGGLAILVAAIAVFFFLRCRRSPRIRRNLGSPGKWHDLESKKSTPVLSDSRKASELPLHDDSLDEHQPVSPYPTLRSPTAVAPLLVNAERHLSSDAANPFADPFPSPPRRQSSKDHYRRGSVHRHSESFELTSQTGFASRNIETSSDSKYNFGDILQGHSLPETPAPIKA